MLPSRLVGPIMVAPIVVIAVSVSAQATRNDAPEGTTRAWSPARTPDGQPICRACGQTPASRHSSGRGRSAVVRLRAAKDNVHEFACYEGNVDVIRGISGVPRAEEAAQR